MSWRLRPSVETLLRLTPAVAGSTGFSIAGGVRRPACLDNQAVLDVVAVTLVRRKVE